MKLDERLMRYEEQEETLGDMDGALLVRDARDCIAQLGERVRELEKIKNIKCPYCARQYFLTPDGQAVADPYRGE